MAGGRGVVGSLGDPQGCQHAAQSEQGPAGWAFAQDEGGQQHANDRHEQGPAGQLVQAGVLGFGEPDDGRGGGADQREERQGGHEPAGPRDVGLPFAEARPDGQRQAAEQQVPAGHDDHVDTGQPAGQQGAGGGGGRGGQRQSSPGPGAGRRGHHGQPGQSEQQGDGGGPGGPLPVQPPRRQQDQQRLGVRQDRSHALGGAGSGGEHRSQGKGGVDQPEQPDQRPGPWPAWQPAVLGASHGDQRGAGQQGPQGGEPQHGGVAQAPADRDEARPPRQGDPDHPAGMRSSRRHHRGDGRGRRQLASGHGAWPASSRS